MIAQFHISLSNLHRHRLPSYVSQFPLSSGVLVSDFRHFDPLHTHNRIQRIKYLSDVLRHLIRLPNGSVCCRITVSFMVHPHHSNLAFARTMGNTADTFAPHHRSFGTRRLFHQTRSVQPAVSSVFCFHLSSSRPFHECFSHGMCYSSCHFPSSSSSLYGFGSSIQALTNRSFARQVSSSKQSPRYHAPPNSSSPTYLPTNGREKFSNDSST